MDAEILFFMSAKDQAEFLDVAKEYCDEVIETPQKMPIELIIGSCKLLFTPSEFEKTTLFIGKLEIRSSEYSEDVSLKDLERAKSIFRKLRNWLKKAYWSRLAYLNANKKDKLTPSRNHWLGPDAKLWKEGDENKRILKLSKTSWMVFELGY